MYLALRPHVVLQRIPRWLIPYLIVSLFALGAALGVNAFVAKSLSVDPARLASLELPAETDSGAAPAPTGQEPKVQNSGKTSKKTTTGGARKLSFFLTPILNRNLFDSANSLSTTISEDEGEQTEEIRKSDLDIQLLATAEATDPRWSTALLSAESEPPQVYRIGDAILEAILHDIKRPWLDTDGGHHPARIVVKRDGQLEYIDAGGKAKKKGKKKGKKKDKKKDKKKTKRGGRHQWTGIHDQGGGKYSIEQKEVDWALGNLDKLSREARVVPNFADGATNGFKVFSIRRNSALRKMGLKNNDVLTSVNGLDLSNTEKALEIYSKLQADKHFSLELLRNGEPMTLEYDVQ